MINITNTQLNFENLLNKNIFVFSNIKSSKKKSMNNLNKNYYELFLNIKIQSMGNYP